MTMPAPTGVSGPGALSQRTDLQPMSVPTGLPYGQAGALAQAEQAAPMPQDPASQASTAQAASFAQAASAVQSPPVSPPPTLDQPSQRPGEPVTHGADAGPGAGSSVLYATPGVPAGGQISQTIAQAAANDPTGLLAQLGAIAQQRGL